MCPQSVMLTLLTDGYDTNNRSHPASEMSSTAIGQTRPRCHEGPIHGPSRILILFLLAAVRKENYIEN